MEEATNADKPKKKETSRAHKIAGWSACALWVLSIVLSFCIPPNSPSIWLPDTVLLLGFFPLIWICPWSLVWIAWGVLTTFIGWFLLLLTCIPDSSLPAQSHDIKHHLAQYHLCWPWQILGVMVTISGTIRLIINIVKMIGQKKIANRRSS